MGLYLGNILLKLSLKARLNAWVGKYLMQLVKLPSQNRFIPCSLRMRDPQSTMPVYLGTSPLLIFGLASWVCTTSLIRSMGAVIVFAVAPDTPPRRKSSRKLLSFAMAVPPATTLATKF